MSRQNTSVVTSGVVAREVYLPKDVEERLRELAQQRGVEPGLLARDLLISAVKYESNRSSPSKE